MDLATLVGLVGALTIVGGVIFVGGSIGAFVDTPALLLVIGGTLLVTLMKFSFSSSATQPRSRSRRSPIAGRIRKGLIGRSVALANQARTSDLLALEETAVPDDWIATIARRPPRLL